jgi:hypothetical protein
MIEEHALRGYQPDAELIGCFFSHKKSLRDFRVRDQGSVKNHPRDERLADP